MGIQFLASIKDDAVQTIININEIDNAYMNACLIAAVHERTITTVEINELLSFVKKDVDIFLIEIESEMSDSDDGEQKINNLLNSLSTTDIITNGTLIKPAGTLLFSGTDERI